jgi:PhzF family phenazine biosynthesis protein
MASPLTIYQIDAFAPRIFAGNPAAVCPLDHWIDDATMQSIATENNLSETAFFVKEGDLRHIRWFTPSAEIDLCGHATLASAHAIREYIDPGASQIDFISKSGPLAVFEKNGLLFLDFPSRPATPATVHPDLLSSLGAIPEKVLKSRDYLAVYRSEEEVRSLTPDFSRLKRVDALGIIATAPSVTHDFISRFFAPSMAIDEDPATGSAHCTLIPYWADRLGKKEMTSFQASKRGGEFVCALSGDRVHIGGKCVVYMEGKLYI